MNFGLARRKIEELKQSAINFPGDHLFLQIDGMDNSKREDINKYLVAQLKTLSRFQGVPICRHQQIIRMKITHLAGYLKCHSSV